MIRAADLLSALATAALLCLWLGLVGAALAQNAPRDAFPPGAPPMPVCNQWRDGVAACLGGRSCLCRFERGGSLAGRPDGHRWDCGALRPACDLPPAAPPDAGGGVAPWPGTVTVLPEVSPPGWQPPAPRPWR